MQTLQQQRAKFALERLSMRLRAAGPPSAQAPRTTPAAAGAHEEFASVAAGFPAMIQMNGLGQAAAFFNSKGGLHAELYGLLSDWLCKKDGQPYFGCSGLLAGITGHDMYRYRLAQAEALLLLDWVKKFAKANSGAVGP